LIASEATIALPLEGVIDSRLNNPGFVAKAPPEVLEESRERKAELEARKAKVDEALGRLG
jgi:valyl-tRNA synthetase